MRYEKATATVKTRLNGEVRKWQRGKIEQETVKVRRNKLCYCWYCYLR